MKRLPLMIVLAAPLVLAGAGALAFFHLHRSDAPIPPGTSLMSIEADYVLMVSYTSGAGTVTAQRSRQGGEFTVLATHADDRPARHCTASADLAGQLATWSSLPTLREISLDERGAAFPVYMGRLLVQSASEEPNGALMVFTNEARTALAVILDGHAAQVGIPLTALARLASGCDGLARR